MNPHPDVALPNFSNVTYPMQYLDLPATRKHHRKRQDSRFRWRYTGEGHVVLQICTGGKGSLTGSQSSFGEPTRDHKGITGRTGYSEAIFSLLGESVFCAC